MGVVIVWIILSFLIASAGSSRKIGYLQSLFISLLLSPIIGLIVVLFSDKNSDRLNSLKIAHDSKAISDEQYNQKVREIIPSSQDKSDTKNGTILFFVLGLIIYLIVDNCSNS